MAMCITIDLAQRESQRDQSQWPLTQTFCFPKQEDVRAEAGEIKYVEDYFRCHKDLETEITKA